MTQELGTGTRIKSREIEVLVRKIIKKILFFAHKTSKMKDEIKNSHAQGAVILRPR